MPADMMSGRESLWIQNNRMSTQSNTVNVIKNNNNDYGFNFISDKKIDVDNMKKYEQ